MEMIDLWYRWVRQMAEEYGPYVPPTRYYSSHLWFNLLHDDLNDPFSRLSVPSEANEFWRGYDQV